MKRKKVLICDVDQNSIQMLSRVFQRHSLIDTIPTQCGQEVLMYLKQSPTPPDLLIINTLLPDMDGDNLTQTIRVKSKFRDLPIILMSGNFDDIDRLAKVVGASGFLKKPLSLGKVQEKIASVIA